MTPLQLDKLPKKLGIFRIEHALTQATIVYAGQKTAVALP